MSEKIVFLISRFKEGEQSAFKELYTIYYQKVASFASLYVRNKQDVQDVVQEIFIKLWEKRENIVSNNNFDGYLFILTRNYIFNLKRSMLNMQAIDITLLNIVDKMQNIEEELESKDLQLRINKILDNLPSQRKRIFMLSRNEHKTYREIAEILNTSEKSVEYNISMVLNEIRIHIKDSPDILLLVWMFFLLK